MPTRDMSISGNWLTQAYLEMAVKMVFFWKHLSSFFHLDMKLNN